MSEWRPIEGAPKGGMPIWVHNGRHYGIAKWHVCEPESATVYEWTGGDLVLVPNPTAGNILSFWLTDWATSEDRDHDGCYEGPEPTHWMPLQEPPR